MSRDGRYRQLIRCIRLMRAVEGRRTVDLDALAHQFRVSSRTIRRDVAALAIAGVRVPVVGKAYTREMAA